MTYRWLTWYLVRQSGFVICLWWKSNPRRPGKCVGSGDQGADLKDIQNKFISAQIEVCEKITHIQEEMCLLSFCLSYLHLVLSFGPSLFWCLGFIERIIIRFSCQKQCGHGTRDPVSRQVKGGIRRIAIGVAEPFSQARGNRFAISFTHNLHEAPSN